LIDRSSDARFIVVFGATFSLNESRDFASIKPPNAVSATRRKRYRRQKRHSAPPIAARSLYEFVTYVHLHALPTRSIFQIIYTALLKIKRNYNKSSPSRLCREEKREFTLTPSSPRPASCTCAVSQSRHHTLSVNALVDIHTRSNRVSIDQTSIKTDKTQPSRSVDRTMISLFSLARASSPTRTAKTKPREKSSPHALFVLTLFVHVSLVFALPRKVEGFAATLVERYEQVRAKVSVRHVELGAFHLLARRHHFRSIARARHDVSTVRPFPFLRGTGVGV
jgi:hypothetical protein